MPGDSSIAITRGLVTMLLRVALLAAVVVMTSGCRNGDSSPAGQSESVPGKGAGAEAGQSSKIEPAVDVNSVWQKMLETYRSATSYQDAATISLTFVDNGSHRGDKTKISVQWAPPNRLSLEAFRVRLVCDGERLRASIQDPETGNVDGQVLTRRIASKLTVDDLLSDPLLSDQLSNPALAPEVNRLPPQLEWLLGEADGAPSVDDTAPLRLLDRKPIAGHDCFRIERATKQGKYLYWIDVEKHLVRRLEYPTEVIAPALVKQEGLKEVQLIADFTDVRVNEEFAVNDFRWPMSNAATAEVTQPNQPVAQPPAAVRPVRYFIPPPIPLPTTMFGKECGPLRLTVIAPGPGSAVGTAARADDVKKPTSGNSAPLLVTKESLREKIAILLWYRDHPLCEDAALQLHELYRDHFAEAKDVALWAVSMEPTTLSDSQVLSATRRWKVDLPIVRDRQAHGRDQLGIAGAPTLVILDQQSRVQFFETGTNPNWRAQLPKIIERLRRGDDLAREIEQQHQRELDEYRRQLEAANPDAAVVDTMDPPDVPLAAVAPAQRITLQAAWKMAVEQGTSAVWFAGDGSEPQLEFLEAGRSIVRVNMQGERIAEVALKLPEGVSVDLVTTAVDEQSQRHYVVGKSQSGEVYWFNQRGELLSSFSAKASGATKASGDGTSATDEPVAGLRELQLFRRRDLPTLSCAVVWAGLGGVQMIDQRGDVVWTNRRLAPNLSIAGVVGPVESDRGGGVDGATDRLWVCGEQGALMSLRGAGRSGIPRELAGWRVQQLAAATVGKGPAASGLAANDSMMAALSYNRRGEVALVAFDQDVREQWSYPLPSGTLPSRNRRLVSGSFFAEGAGDWAVAAADGTIHLVSADGATSDFVATGERLTGVAIGRIEDQAWLVYSSPTSINAYRWDGVLAAKRTDK